MKVKFTQAYTTKTGNDPDARKESFEEGQVVDFAELRGDAELGRRSARHYTNKGVAVELKTEEKHAHRTHAGEHTPVQHTPAQQPAKKDEPPKGR